MQALIGGLAHPITRLHDYRDAHKVKIQLEKEHLIMLLGYGGYLVFHNPILMFASYGLVTVLQGKMMIVLDSHSRK